MNKSLCLFVVSFFVINFAIAEELGDVRGQEGVLELAAEAPLLQPVIDYEQESLAEDEGCCYLYPESKWKGKMNFGLSDEAGNSNTDTLEGEIKVERITCLDQLMLYRWGIDTKFKTKLDRMIVRTREGRVRFFYEHMLTRHWAGRASEQFRWNKGQKLNFEFETEIGLGYYIFNNDYLTLMPFLGVARTHSYYEQSTGLQSGRHFYDMVFGYTIDWDVTKWMNITHYFEYDPQFNHPNKNYSWESELVFNFPLTECWVLAVEYDYDYNTFLRPGVKYHWDQNINVKLSYKF